jgi:hypothetical protein
MKQVYRKSKNISKNYRASKRMLRIIIIGWSWYCVLWLGGPAKASSRRWRRGTLLYECVRQRLTRRIVCRRLRDVFKDASPVQ